jgi:hypothetical protein
MRAEGAVAQETIAQLGSLKKGARQVWNPMRNIQKKGPRAATGHRPVLLLPLLPHVGHNDGSTNKTNMGLQRHLACPFDLPTASRHRPAGPGHCTATRRAREPGRSPAQDKFTVVDAKFAGFLHNVNKRRQWRRWCGAVTARVRTKGASRCACAVLRALEPLKESCSFGGRIKK